MKINGKITEISSWLENVKRCQIVFDSLKLPKVDGIACPEVVEYNVHEYIPEKGKDASHNV